MSDSEFRHTFKDLTGFGPLRWQERMFHEFVANRLPNIIDLPTGLGKTMIMAIWLIARSSHPDKSPTRLIYVVDRRTVVDQATDIAITLQDNFGRDEHGKHKIAIATLRGQLADNREWLRDPSRPAIIIGTVDLIGSALLFSGYRSSFKTKPLHAGLLGQDSLLVLDEAHLSKPFEKLITSIHNFQSDHQRASTSRDREGAVAHVKPMRVIRMSATSEGTDGDRFKLEDSDLVPEVADRAGKLVSNPIVERFNAKKRLTIKSDIDPKKINDALADAAISLTKDLALVGKRIVVFVRKPDDATKIADAIRKQQSGMAKPGPYTDSVEVLTGTMRGLERDELLKTPVLKRFLDGNEDPQLELNKQPVFLISTSAGEVGFDLNADHLVGDAAPLDSWIQRLGRVNRRGKGDATVVLIKQKEPSEKSDFDKACSAATKLLTDGMNVSPHALAAFQKSLTPEQLKAVTTPEPKMVELTDILLDAWSMTSITAQMPGRPEVAPWLRGIADELPQTTIAWRAELDLPGFAELDVETVEEWFDTHRILTHETLSVPTTSKSEGSAEKWMKTRWEQLGKTLGDEQQRAIGNRPVIIERAGLRVMQLVDLITELDRGNTASIRNADLILPASFGGIERGKGLLESSAPEIPKDEDKQPINEQRKARADRCSAPDVADIAPGRQRLREVITKSEDSEPDKRGVANGLKPDQPLKFRIDLNSDDDKRVTLVSYIPRRENPEFGSSKPETLASHVRKVRKAVDAILERLALSDDIKQAAQFAADYHDHGKNRERWQRSVSGVATPPDEKWSDHTRGKSGGEMKRDGRGYRHEFGSLREFTDAFNAGRLLDHQGQPISQDVFDLAMHLIATHHGRGRPHFAKGGFDPDAESSSVDIHTAAIQRFGRLQRKYGWWHLAWLENLLRCADAAASAGLETDDHAEELEGGGT